MTKEKLTINQAADMIGEIFEDTAHEQHFVLLQDGDNLIGKTSTSVKGLAEMLAASALHDERVLKSLFEAINLALGGTQDSES